MSEVSSASAVDAVAVVLNPNAGDSSGAWVYPQVAEILREHGVEFACFETAPNRGAAPAADRALRAGFEDVWVVGGDGTVRQCLPAIMQADAVLGVIAAGTSNCLAMETGPMLPNPAMLAAWMLRQPVRRMDVGECNGEPFTVRMGVGLEALAARITERDKRGVGPVAYLMAGIQAISENQPLTLTVEADGQVIYRRAAIGAILSNLRLHPMLSFVGRESVRPDDGLLHATIIEDEPIAAHFAEWLGGVTRGDPHLEGIVEHRAVEFHLHSEGAAHTHVDGEDIGVHNDLTVRCMPGALKVRGLEPPGGTPRS